MISKSLPFVPRQFTLEEWNEREYELAEKTEEIEAQKEELNAAVEELISKNAYLERALHELSQRKDELDQLIYRMSHDLRTPVTSIMGVCQLMRLEGVPVSFHFHLDHIQHKIMELDQLLKSLSAFSQVALEAIRRDTVSPLSVLQDVLNALRTEPGFAEVRFTLPATDALLVFVSDRQKIFLILHHIIRNAIQFREKGREHQVTIELKVEHDNLIFTCTDNGIGILPEVQPKIFGMFYRGTERSKGPGLGLYIVKEIVFQLRGTVDVTSEPGQTCFRVVIPSLAGTR